MVSLFAEETTFFLSSDRISKSEFENYDFEVIIKTDTKDILSVSIETSDVETSYDLEELKTRIDGEPENCLKGLQLWFNDLESSEKDKILNIAGEIFGEDNYNGIHIDFFLFGVAMVTFAFHIAEKMDESFTKPFDLYLTDEYDMVTNFSSNNFKQLRYLGKIFSKLPHKNIYSQVIKSVHEFVDSFRYFVIVDDDTMIYPDLERKIIEGLLDLNSKIPEMVEGAIKNIPRSSVDIPKVTETIVKEVSLVVAEQFANINTKNDEAFIKIAERSKDANSKYDSVLDIYKQMSNLLNRVDVLEKAYLSKDEEDEGDDSD